MPDEETDVVIDTQVLVDAPGAMARNVTIQRGGDLVIGGSGSLQVIEAIVVESGGRLSVGAGGSVAVQDLIVEPGGEVNWTGGAITIDAGQWSTGNPIGVGCTNETAVLTVTNGGSVIAPSVTICVEGSVNGDGSLIASVLNAGVVSPGLSAGLLTIGGDFEQAALGRLQIDLGGLLPQVEHDVLAITGLVTLDGILSLTAINGFDVLCGDEFQVLSAIAIRGDFATIKPPTVVCGNMIELQIDEVGLMAVVAPSKGSPDINCDGSIGVPDLLAVINAWGACPVDPCGCPADLNSDEVVGVPDLLLVINNWGS